MEETRSGGGGLQGELSRRALLAGIGAGAAAYGLAGAMEALASAAEALPAPALSPEDPQVKATMAAFADTIVPGPAGGADELPGAVEAGAVEEMYDPFYGVRASFPILHDDLQAQTPLILGRPATFELALPYPDRERVVAERIEAGGEGGDNLLYLIYIGAATIAYISYYGTARSRLGPKTIHFPPESDGYFPHHTYGVRFEGMTREGNPR